MGIVPFIMASTLGVPYTTILKMVLLIAILWYVSVIIYILAASARLNLRQADGADERPLIPIDEAVRSAALMIVPVGTLIMLIFRNWPLVDAVTWATVTLGVLAVVLRVERSPGVWWDGIKRAAITASAFSMAIVVVQYITEILFFSTLIIRVGALVDVLGAGSLIVAGFVVLIFGVLVSGPLPPLAVYFVMVIAFQPVFFELGLPPSITVFAAFYTGVLGAITLPMAPSTMVAAGIAKAPFLETALETMKVASAAFFIPFLILLAPELLLSAPGVPPSSPGHIVLVFATAIASLSALSFGLVGWLRGPIRLPARIALGSVALAMIVALQQDSDLLLWALPVDGVGTHRHIGWASAAIPQEDVSDRAWRNKRQRRIAPPGLHAGQPRWRPSARGISAATSAQSLVIGLGAGTLFTTRGGLLVRNTPDSR